MCVRVGLNLGSTQKSPAEEAHIDVTGHLAHLTGPLCGVQNFCLEAFHGLRYYSGGRRSKVFAWHLKQRKEEGVGREKEEKY